MEENSVGVLDLPNRANLLSSLTILALRFASSLAHPEVTCKAMSRSVMDTLSSIMKSFPGWTPGNQWVFIMPKNCDLGQTLVTFAVPWLRWRPVVGETAMVHGWRRGRGDPERHGRLFSIKVLFLVLVPIGRASTVPKNWEFVRVCTICTSPYPYKNWPSYHKIVLNRTFVDALVFLSVQQWNMNETSLEFQILISSRRQ